MADAAVKGLYQVRVEAYGGAMGGSRPAGTARLLQGGGRPSASRTESAVTAALTAVGEAPSIVEALRRIEDVQAGATLADVASAQVLGEAAAQPRDQVLAIAAVHGLGSLPDAAGHPALLALLDAGPAHIREHAAWALGAGPPVAAAMDHLTTMVATGGFPGMLAQRTLEQWAELSPTHIRQGIGRALAAASDVGARSRLVETLGLVPGRPGVETLVALATDVAEEPAVRAAALGALGDVTTADDIDDVLALNGVADGQGALADVARAAVHDSWSTAGPVEVLTTEDVPAASAGLTVVQLFLHAEIDAELSHAGQGDTGGIATLLVQLGDALVDPGGPGLRTTRTITVSRGRPADALIGLERLAAQGHHYATVPLWGEPVHAAQAWPLRVAARRGIRRVLRAARPVDIVHLRMADVGSMAAAEAAAELGIPTVLTLAPDPHALIHAREEAGTLTRECFGAADLSEHLVFRDWLLRHLAARADHLVLFPRPALSGDLETLLGVDLTDPTVRATVVAEGVDLDTGERAAGPADLADLDGVLARLPAERRHLPLALTVGRLHRVKGMATLASSWASDPELQGACNLLVVGGDLDDPTDDEAAELAGIDAAVPSADAARRGLLLAGHRPNTVVRRWMTAALEGRPGLAAPSGVYVSASLKEEFGIAILEAMASGLLVVAPAAGGPATYVEDGVTGVLVDTTRAEALASGLSTALALASDPGATRRADAARAGLRERFSIRTMAAALDEVYQEVTSVLQDEELGWAPARAGAGTAGS